MVKVKSLNLRVAEAKARDVGRGIARIDPQDLETIGAEVGDIIEIEGKRKTVAKVMPAYPEDRGKSIIQMDGLLRGNAQVSLDERVNVQKTGCSPADKIILSPLTLTRSISRERDAKYIGTLLDGLPLIEGDTIRANLFGTRSRDFTVTSTVPKGAVLVRSNTRIEIKERGEARGFKISYEDIGGLGKELQRVREMIELPLKYPQVFERLGIDPPKGVLLHGPPGCGKTLIARAVANETAAYFTHITGPEIMGKFYGESEARLRAVFEEAKANAPAILFIDEIDAIAPKREEMGGEKQVERRVVAQLLALMDGLESRGEVVVIGATNIPNSLDTALRRPGRFDREIAISIPDQRGRLEILHIHTRGMPLAQDVGLERLSQITHGFVGADLEALCREAAMNALRKIMPSIDFQLDEIPYETLLQLEVTMNDFREALKEVEPSAIREVFVEVPDVKWEDIGGLDEVKQKLIEAVEWPLKYPDLFQQANTKPPKGILFSGPPGTGKTLAAKALANESEVNFISVKGPELMSKYVGESERGVREVFKKAKQASPCILFFDEFDSLVPERGLSSDSQVTERVISQFLTELDGLEELKGVLVLAATNRKDLIDSAILRPGRFDFDLEFPLPDVKARTEIFKVHTRGKPLASDVDPGALAQETEGIAGSDIEAICREASMAAIRESVKAGFKGKLQISRKHFDLAIQSLRTRKGE
ncbi:MAG: CDC48 family AAA ATPase [Chloroflexi bacterium]|nr:CDC48 family AAA ATPase [Chloroflexota bacterium]